MANPERDSLFLLDRPFLIEYSITVLSVLIQTRKEETM